MNIVSGEVTMDAEEFERFFRDNCEVAHLTYSLDDVEVGEIVGITDGGRARFVVMIQIETAFVEMYSKRYNEVAVTKDNDVAGTGHYYIIKIGR